MEIGKAAAVGLEPVLQILPAADRVHGLVAGELFQERGGRIPGDAAHFEEADVEPAREQVLQVELERGQHRVALAQVHQLGAHVDQELHALGQRVELRQELDARRLERLMQRALEPALLVLALGAAQALPVRLDGGAVDVELGREHAQEALAPGLVQGEICAPERGGARARRHLAALAFEALAQLGAHALFVFARKVGLGRARHDAARRGGDVAPDMAQIADRAVETESRKPEPARSLMARDYTVFVTNWRCESVKAAMRHEAAAARAAACR